MPEPGPGVTDFDVQVKDPNNVNVTIPGAPWPMYSLRLIFRDKMSVIDSEEKIVPWKSALDKKAEILNIFGEKLPGVDVTLELDKDTLIMTVDRNTDIKKESDKKESKGKNKSATF